MTAAHDRSFCQALLQLCSAADEACAGVGVEPLAAGALVQEGALCLFDSTGRSAGATLCKRLDPLRVGVLPRIHTPQSGLTVRSLSHHLALCNATEVRPSWQFLPHISPSPAESREWNVLVVPWPLTLTKGSFRPVAGAKGKMPFGFGYFTLEAPHTNGTAAKRIGSLLERAAGALGRSVDCVVLPELALSIREHLSVSKVVLAAHAMLITGVGETSRRGTPGRNMYRVDVPCMESHPFSVVQHKHHRWRLDPSQIETYGLSRLDPDRQWWEHIGIEPRELRFLVLQPWLVLAVLICEDLARLDPVSDCLRAVGPNLVISLLLDGPQLDSRWPARYATVLADDPGSAVLTVTSLGMAELSRPKTLPKDTTPSRAICLWKEPGKDAESIKLPPGKEAALLRFRQQFREEWTADGRTDRGASGYPSLLGYTFLGGR